MKARTKTIYGQKRVLVRLEHMVDPLMLAGIDELARRRSVSRAQCVRDALYTAVYLGLRAGTPLKTAPNVPYRNYLEDAPRMRVVNGKLVSVDEFGIPV